MVLRCASATIELVEAGDHAGTVAGMAVVVPRMHVLASQSDCSKPHPPSTSVRSKRGAPFFERAVRVGTGPDVSCRSVRDRPRPSALSRPSPPSLAFQHHHLSFPPYTSSSHTSSSLDIVARSALFVHSPFLFLRYTAPWIRLSLFQGLHNAPSADCSLLSLPPSLGRPCPPLFSSISLSTIALRPQSLHSSADHFTTYSLSA